VGLRTMMSRIRMKLDERPDSVQEWRTCPVCHGTSRPYTDVCSFCAGHGKYYYYGLMRKTLRERLCFHRWLYETCKARFCKRCGLHQHRAGVLFHRWETVWSVREAGVLPALVWWHSMSEKKRRLAIGASHPTYGDIQNAYETRAKRGKPLAAGETEQH
jgi:hypothetical protein